jgi:C1A family cysteine protease
MPELNQQFMLENVVSSIPDTRDFLYVPSSNKLPSFIDLKPDVFEIDNQLTIGSCTANAATSACEFILKKNNKAVSLSRLFTYWHTRNIVEDRPKGEGATMRNAIRSLHHTGTPPEVVWPYLISNVDTEPSAAAKTAASKYKVTKYESIFLGARNVEDRAVIKERKLGIHAIKSALADGLPVVFSMQVSPDIFKVKGAWKEHIVRSTQEIGSSGGHAMLLIGYDDSTERFLVENSWGSAYGDGGFVGIPYNALNADIMEALIIREFAGYTLNSIYRTQSLSTAISYSPIADIKVLDADANAVASWTEYLDLKPTGGTAPLVADWGLSKEVHPQDSNVVKLPHYWITPPGNLKQVDRTFTCKVRDMSYPYQQVKEVEVKVHYERGYVAPIEPPKPVEPVPVVQPKREKNNIVVILLTVALLGLAVAARYNYL